MNNLFDATGAVWFGVLLTLGVWALALRLRAWRAHPLTQPVFVAVLLLLGILVVTGIDYSTYNQGGRWLSLLLEPTVVAFALPLYSERARIRAYLLPIGAGVAAGCVAGIASAVAIARFFGGDGTVQRSLAPKSVTSPIANGIAEHIGGQPSLTVGLVIATGILGAMCGPDLLRRLGFKQRWLVGLATGITSHGIGTERMRELDQSAGGGDEGKAFSMIGLTLNGVLTALLIPWLLESWFGLAMPR
jgi:predicted murein hydrolase (TIGR00659 family)